MKNKKGFCFKDVFRVLKNATLSSGSWLSRYLLIVIWSSRQPGIESIKTINPTIITNPEFSINEIASSRIMINGGNKAPRATPTIPIGVCIPVAFLRSSTERNLSGKRAEKRIRFFCF